MLSFSSVASHTMEQQQELFARTTIFADSPDISWLLTRKRISTTFLKHKSRAIPPHGPSRSVDGFCTSKERGGYATSTTIEERNIWMEQWMGFCGKDGRQQIDMYEDEGRSAMQFRFNGNRNLIINPAMKRHQVITSRDRIKDRLGFDNRLRCGPSLIPDK